MFAWDTVDDYDIDMKYVLLAVWCHPPPLPLHILTLYGIIVVGQTKQMPRDNNLLGLISNYASDSRGPVPFPLQPGSCPGPRSGDGDCGVFCL